MAPGVYVSALKAVAFSLLVTSITSQTTDPFLNFDANAYPVCKPLQRAVSALNAEQAYTVYGWCQTFVGTKTTTLVYEEQATAYANLPLKTVTVTKKAKRDESSLDTHETVSSAAKGTNTKLSLITEAPIRDDDQEYHELLRKAAPTPATPSLLKGLASKALRTACACIGVSRTITIPVYGPDTTRTITIPSSCLSPAALSAPLRAATYGPASISSELYEYGALNLDDNNNRVVDCCFRCYYSQGCYQFVAIDDPPYGSCNMFFFNNYEGAPNPKPGLPARPSDADFCPRGYVGLGGVSAAPRSGPELTYVGRCAATTVAK